MQIQFNTKSWGACPICKRRKWCAIQFKMSEALAQIKETSSDYMEAVIYMCPAFDEEF